jgi:ligand-binding sensor domain-containing protein
LCVSAEGIYALGPNGIWLYSGKPPDSYRGEKKNYNIARSIRDVISDNNGGLWIGTDVGLYHVLNDSVQHFVQKKDVISAYIRGVAIDGGKIWAAGLGGVTLIQDGVKTGELLPEHGIPSINVNCVERSRGGVMWVGTDVGVVRYLRDGGHSLLFSRRWLLDDKVNDIAFDSEDNAWIATANGVSAIKRKKMTLATKQLYFYDVLMRRHIREPWIAGQCRLSIAGDTTR